MPKKSVVYLLPDDEFISLIKKSKSYSDVLRSFGLKTCGGSSTDALKIRISKLKCDTSHFESQTHSAVNKIKTPLSDILIENSTYTNMCRLKLRLVKENIMEYVCAICGNTGNWNGYKLSLQLDHINGKNNDHRITNLRFLCPNCHSQTETFCRKSKIQ